MRNARYALSALASLTIVAASPVAVSQDIYTQKELSADTALLMAQGALEKCRADGYPITIAIIDSNNIMKLFVRDDRSGIVSSDLSRRKAYTALAFRRSSGEMAKIWRSATPPVIPPPETAAAGGALPIKVGEEVIGAIGISGAPDGDKDESCATAGLAKVAGRLK